MVKDDLSNSKRCNACRINEAQNDSEYCSECQRWVAI